MLLRVLCKGRGRARMERARVASARVSRCRGVEVARVRGVLEIVRTALQALPGERGQQQPGLARRI